MHNFAPSGFVTSSQARYWRAAAVLLTVASLLGGCASSGPSVEESKEGGNRTTRTFGVNGYLWRASLETIGFMPLTAADPFGGVILSDWYSPPANAAERKKVTIYITDRGLRADALKVVVFRQQNRGSEWSNPEPMPEIARQLENTILARARELRLASLQVN